MLRVMVVAALVALAVPVGAYPAASLTDVALDSRSASGAPLGLQAVPTGSPLARADPAIALPLLMKYGYAGSSRMLDQDAQPGSSEDETDEETVTIFHDFLPLGDANGNGRDDVILITYDEETENGTYQALDGGREGDVIWSMKVDEDSYAYLTGDVDEDGVYDLERVEDDGGSGSEDGSSSEVHATVTILNGRDLAEMATLQISSTQSSEQTRPEPLPFYGKSSSSFHYSYEFVHDLIDQAGMARITYNVDMTDTQDGFGPMGTQASYYNQSSFYTLLDPNGALVWSSEEPGWDFDYYDSSDATDDGIPDLVMHSASNERYSSGGALPFVDPGTIPVPIPGMEPAEHKRAPYVLRLLDGIDGNQLWSKEFGFATYSYTAWFDDLFGKGPVLYLYTIDFEATSEDELERSLLLDGKTGEVLKEISDDRSLIDLGDADQDGDGDLLALDYEDKAYFLEAMDGDFASLWTLKLDREEFYGIIDMTGDGVLDILQHDDDNFTVLSGRDGQAAWTRELADVVDTDLSPGIASEDDTELGLLVSGAEDEDDFANHTASLFMVRGSDGAPLWNKPVYDPADYPPVAADDASIYLYSAGDLNGDGANDFVMDLHQRWTISMSTTCDGDDCETEIEDSRDDDVGQPLAIVALVDGASGATVLRFDDMILNPKIEEVHEEAVDVKPAAEELTEDDGTFDVPGVGFYGALVAVGIALVLRRRKA